MKGFEWDLFLDRSWADWVYSSDYLPYCITHIKGPYTTYETHLETGYTYLSCGYLDESKVQTMLMERPETGDPSNGGGGVHDPRIIGGIVGAVVLFVLVLSILGTLLCWCRRRRRRHRSKQPDAQGGKADGQNGPACSAAAELSPDTKKSELQCPDDPPAAGDRLQNLSPRNGQAVQSSQETNRNPVYASSQMAPPIGELAGSNEAAGRENGPSDGASKTHATVERNSVSDRITV